MILAMEVYRILVYRRMADLIAEAEQSRLVAQVNRPHHKVDPGHDDSGAGGRSRKPRIEARPLPAARG